MLISFRKLLLPWGFLLVYKIKEVSLNLCVIIFNRFFIEVHTFLYIIILYSYKKCYVDAEKIGICLSALLNDRHALNNITIGNGHVLTFPKCRLRNNKIPVAFQSLPLQNFKKASKPILCWKIYYDINEGIIIYQPRWIPWLGYFYIPLYN